MNSRNALFFLVIAVLFGLGGLWYFAGGVRSVDVVGLFGCGAACGAALAGFVTNLRMRRSKAMA
ncbi:MAG TPA: hypothetical protein VFG73_06950 [Rhodanobacteraceae bacterium]|nr:hypothetical protein [Rhodanobacteraceae bacterium]